ncbi:unnamed protein product [Orchesella dallaii]|uniref:Uncharacterized protein n=1 Tax=Orchesella dallaii TaxID=48710 RepID=A0ABP1RP60_9HEXA
MNRDTNSQQQSRPHYHYPPYSPGPPNCNEMNSWFCDRLLPTQNGVNPFDIQPQFTKTPLFPNPYPNPASTKTSVCSPVPVRPTDRQFVPKAVYEAVLDKNRMYISQIKHWQENNKNLKGPHFELKTKLSRSKERIKSLELQRNSLQENIKNGKRKISDLEANLKKSKRLELQLNNAKKEANICKKESSIKELKCNKLIYEKIELRDKVKELKAEVSNFKTELQAEEDTNQKLSFKVRTLQKTLLQLQKTLECHKSAHKKELVIQQKEFNRKLKYSSVAIDNENRQYKSVLIKMNKLKKEYLDTKEQMNKIKLENSNLQAKFETQKETAPCKCDCAKEAEDLWKLVRQLQQSTKDSQVQPTQKRK